MAWSIILTSLSVILGIMVVAQILYLLFGGKETQGDDT